MVHARLIQIGTLILLLESILIVLWFYQAQPETKTALDVFTVVPILFGVNLILGLIIYFYKRPVGLLLLANSVLCPLIFFAVWIMWFTYWSQ